jgi:hypothetical protein
MFLASLAANFYKRKLTDEEIDDNRKKSKKGGKK